MKRIKKYLPQIVVLSVLFIVFGIWLNHNFLLVEFDTDLGRDLKEISNIQKGDVVWLGPWLGPGLQASSIYYYLFYPSVEVANGNPLGMIYFNIGFSALLLGLLAWFGYKRIGISIAIILLAIGLSPLLLETYWHPGNGFTYALFTLAALIGVHFSLPTILTSLAVGFATAFHPAALVLMPLIFWEWWRIRRYLLLLVGNLCAFIFPWLPLIAFEIVTKGFIMRRFLANPSSGIVKFGISFENISSVSHLLGLPVLLFLLALGMSFYVALKASKKLAYWHVLVLFSLFAICLVHEVPGRYLYSISLFSLWVMVFSLLQQRFTKFLVALYAVWLVIFSIRFSPTSTNRPIQYVLDNVSLFTSQTEVPKTSTIATVAAMGETALVPQADDYRALLRNQGFQVVDIANQGQADYLVMFIEQPDFPWKNWMSWEIEQFGAKELTHVIRGEKITIAVFEKI